MFNKLSAGVIATIIGLSSVSPAFANTNFTDDYKISDWSEDHIEILVELGVISGYPDGTFRPAANITREEMAVMILESMIVLEDSITASMLENDIYLYEELVAQQMQLFQLMNEVDALQAQKIATTRNWVGISIGATAVDTSDDVLVNLDGKITVLELGFSDLYLSVNPFISTAGEGGAAILVNKDLGDKFSVGAGAGAAIGWDDNGTITSEAGTVEGYGQLQVEYNLSDSSLVYVNGRVPFTGDNDGDVTIMGGVGLRF